MKEPAFTVNVNKFGVNAACVRLLPDVEHVQILINSTRKKLLLLPCDNTIVSGFRWGRTKDGKRYSSQRSGEYFVLTLCRLMNWNPDYRYKILGRMVEANGKPVVAFDLNSYECFPKTTSEDGKKVSSRRAIFSSGEWNGHFGPTYGESKHSLRVNTFDGFTVLSIKENNVKTETQSEQNDMVYCAAEEVVK